MNRTILMAILPDIRILNVLNTSGSHTFISDTGHAGICYG